MAIFIPLSSLQALFKRSQACLSCLPQSGIQWFSKTQDLVGGFRMIGSTTSNLHPVIKINLGRWPL
jgi:hypothetical protein